MNDRKLFALSDEELGIGAMVNLAQGQMSLHRVGRVLDEQVDDPTLSAFGIIPEA